MPRRVAGILGHSWASHNAPDGFAHWCGGEQTFIPGVTGKLDAGDRGVSAKELVVARQLLGERPEPRCSFAKKEEGMGLYTKPSFDYMLLGFTVWVLL